MFVPISFIPEKLSLTLLGEQFEITENRAKLYFSFVLCLCLTIEQVHVTQQGLWHAHDENH